MPALLALALQCAMCNQTAAQQGAKGIAALNAGILVLLLPPLAIAGCISWITWRRAKEAPDEQNPPR